jgi:hypothetical protein
VLSVEEARQYLIQFLGRQNLNEYADINEELATG